MTLKKLIPTLLVWAALLCSVSSFAQSIFDRFGIKQYGNSHDQPFYHAEDIRQDSLNRLVFKYSSNFLLYDDIMEYDGIEFRKRKKLGRGEFLSEDTLHNVTWYKPDLFTAVAYRDDSIFTTIHTDDYLKLNFHRLQQKGDMVIALTNSGLIEYKWLDDELQYVRTIPVESPSGLVDDLLIVKDTLYCNTGEGVTYILYDDTNTQYRLKKVIPNIGLQLPGERIVRSYHPNKNRIINKGSWLHTLLISLKNTRGRYFVDSKGRFWTYITSGENKGFNVFQKNSMVGQKIDLGIPENTLVKDIYEDHEGSIWVGTKGEGLIQIYEKTIQILDSNNNLKSDYVSSIAQGTDGSIYLSQDCDGVSVIKPDYSIERMDVGCVKSVTRQSNGHMWINTYGILQYENDNYVKHYLRNDGLHSRTIRSVFEDSKGDLWLGTRQAIHRYNGKDKFIPYVDDSIGFFNRVFNIVELAQDSFLLAFSEGEIMSFYDGKYTMVPSDTNKASHLYKDSQDRIWVATEGDGLHRYIDNKVVPMENSNLMSADISYLQEDNLGNIWSISEDNTIHYADKNKLWNNEKVEVRKYTVADGLPLIHTERRKQPAAELLDDGKIIFPNVHGAIVIDPTKERRVKHEYKSTITYNDSIYALDNTIVLPVGANDIFFGYTNVTLHPENHFEYQYSFTNDNWQNIDNSKAININNVPYGSNTLYIRSRYTDEEWKMDSIKIVAPAPFYYRWWFVLAMLGAVAAFFSWFVKWRTGIVKKQNTLLEEKVYEQTEVIENEKKQLAKSLELQQKLTHELNLSQASKNRMYAQISHEFKSPLQAINSFLSSSEDHITQDDKLRISGNIKQLLNTSSEIMDLSKAESGALRAKKDYYNINNIIQEQIDLKLSLAQDKKINVNFENGSQRVYLHCDISLMQKVVGNLLSNAIKFSDAGETITVKSESQQENQVISITDHGVGIPSEEIENLTVAYFQASNNNEAGTGIGLSLVDKILQLHDSRLDISSRLGKGSTFSFAIKKPKTSHEEIHASHFDEVSIPTQLEQIINPDKPKILAVDDSVDILLFVRRTLSKTYNIVTSTNGYTAIKYLDRIAPDLILSDVNMPIMSGTELLKSVRKLPEYESVPFLLLTGSLSEETELAGLRSGADFVLQKPIEVDYFKSQIKQILSRQSKVIDQAKENFVHGLLPQHMLDDDRKIMMELEKYILEHLDNSKLLSEDIANALGVGEKTLRNRVKNITGYTVKEYLKNFRLEKAKLLIEQNYGTKGEVAAAVGFSSLSYFSKSYKKYFAQRSDR